LWVLGEGTVQQVRESFASRRVLAYTTVMTMLDRLARKTLVTRRKVGRSFVYTPAVTRDEVRQRALREIVGALFDGSRDALARFLAGVPEARAAVVPAAAEPLDASLL
jgi:predicted transcriptional regulator